MPRVGSSSKMTFILPITSGPEWLFADFHLRDSYQLLCARRFDVERTNVVIGIFSSQPLLITQPPSTCLRLALC